MTSTTTSPLPYIVAATAAGVAIGYSFGRSTKAAKCLSTDVIRRLGQKNVVGQNIATIRTPCLVVDLDLMEQNCKRLPETLRDYPNIKIRPHAKAHKSAAIASIQQHLSKAHGICCQKVAEVQAIVENDANHDINDILLSNEVVGMERYIELADIVKHRNSELRMTIIFDSTQAIEQAQKAAQLVGIKFFVLIDVNVGQNRCGVQSKEEALELAQRIGKCDNLIFHGIQAYHGAAQHIRDYEEKGKTISSVSSKANEVQQFLDQNGFACQVVTGAGTGTYILEAASGVFTEVQPGSYIFNDHDYSLNLDADGKQDKQWHQSLFVLTSVMSRSSTGHYAVVDAGLKAVSLDSGPPQLASTPDVVFENGGDEHGKLIYPKTMDLPSLEDRLLLIPGHCDPTVNMYDHILGIRKNVVERVFSVDGRGPGL